MLNHESVLNCERKEGGKEGGKKGHLVCWIMWDLSHRQKDSLPKVVSVRRRTSNSLKWRSSIFRLIIGAFFPTVIYVVVTFLIIAKSNLLNIDKCYHFSRYFYTTFSDLRSLTKDFMRT